MKKILVLIVLITSFISPLDMTHPTMKTLIQQPSKILTDFQGEDASSTNSSFKFDSLQRNTSPIMITHYKVYKLKAISENVFEIVR